MECHNLNVIELMKATRQGDAKCDILKMEKSSNNRSGWRHVCYIENFVQSKEVEIIDIIVICTRIV